jgi:hypothetical protein
LDSSRRRHYIYWYVYLAVFEGFESCMTPIDITSDSNIYLLIKDYLLADFIFKFVMIFAVGYLVAFLVFKK